MSTTVLWYIFEDSLMRQQAQTLLYPVPRPVPRPQQLVDRPEPAPEEALTESPKPERVESLCSHRENRDRLDKSFRDRWQEQVRLRAKCEKKIIFYFIIEKGAGRDGRVGASVGSTGQVGAARGSGWLVEDVGPLIGLSYLAKDGWSRNSRPLSFFRP